MADESGKQSTAGNITTTNKSSKKKSPHHKEKDTDGDDYAETDLKVRGNETNSPKGVDLSHKSLDEIPEEVFKMKDIEILNVSDNHLGYIPTRIANLSNLKEMRAAGCHIREVSEDISRCTYLSKIDLSRNPQLTTLPARMVRLRCLTYVAFCDCKMKSLPKYLTRLSAVETLDLSHNMLTNLPPDFSALKKVRVLILSDNLFTGVPESVSSLNSLSCLEMKQNKLRNNRGDLKLYLSRKLKTLDLEGNQSLYSLPTGYETHVEIEELNVSSCGIKTLPDSIGQLPKLTRIHLGGNKLSRLPESIGHLLDLETLDLDENCLSSLPLSLHNLRKLKEKDTEARTGLILDNNPALKFPEPKIVREGVVSILTELLAEDSLNIVTVTIRDEEVDGTIIDNLSNDIVIIAEEGVCNSFVNDIIQVAIVEQECMEDIFETTYEEVTSSLVDVISKETADEWNVIVGITEEMVGDIIRAMARSVALEQDEERRLGQTVPEEYSKQFSYEISATTTSVQLPAGCNLSIPPGATDEDTSVISAVLNPHGYDGTLELGRDELLVSDIIEMGPAGMTFAKPVKLKIPHSLPKFDREREYIVMTSEDDGKTWSTMKSHSHAEQDHKYVTVEVSHFSSFTVVARPLEHCHRVKKDQASKLRSSDQTGIEVLLPKDSVPEEEEISFKVTPVDEDVLKCAGHEGSQDLNGVDSLSHIIKFFKGSNLLLNSPATIVLPLPSYGERANQVRVLSCNKSGEWEDVTNKVDDIILRESKVAFKTDQLSAGFAVVRCHDSVDATGIVNLVNKHVRARHVRTVIFKKWKEPREEGIMTARMECLLEESVDDRIYRIVHEEKYEVQEGTPTDAVVMVENETICAIFHGDIRPDVEMVNGMYGVNFKFYCERQRRLEFDVKVLGTGKDAFSLVELYPGPRENYHLLRQWETVKPAAPLATATICAPTGVICEYWLACQRFKKTLEIEESYFSPDHDKCFCETCHRDRGDPDSSLRGNPPEKYAVPVGWSRFGLSLNPSFVDEDLNVFSNWHRAYHGTDPDVVKKILQGSSMLLIPGDVALGGLKLGEKEGHFTEDCKPYGFDTKQVFVSPSIKYAGLDAYACSESFQDDYGTNGKTYNARVAFQLCIRPDSYEVGPETVGARDDGEIIDPLFDNEELEWSTKERGGQALYGLLVKLEEEK